ncbi:MAG TPA: hypothetical protein VGC31_06825, partial [Paenirhodobacter sp.]
LDFESGVTGRITCSIAAPYDHRMRIIGNKGMVQTDTYRHYDCPVYLEPFTTLSMNARKARAVRTNSLLQWIFGVNGRRVPLVRAPGPGAKAPVPLLGAGGGIRGRIRRLKAGQLGRQDKSVGLAELAAAIEEGRAHFPSPDFTLHLTELTLAIQGAGPDGTSHRMETRFMPLELRPETLSFGIDYKAFAKPGLLDRISEGLLERMHRH